MRQDRLSCHTYFPVSILYKSIAGCYRSVRVADGPITARCRFIKNAILTWQRLHGLVLAPTLKDKHLGKSCYQTKTFTYTFQVIIMSCSRSRNIWQLHESKSSCLVYIFQFFVIAEPITGFWKRNILNKSLMRPNWPKLASVAQTLRTSAVFRLVSVFSVLKGHSILTLFYIEVHKL